MMGMKLHAIAQAFDRALKPVLLASISLVIALGAGTAARAADYTLGVQDRLRIHVSEWPALTGEFAVGPSGNVSLPIIGEVKATGLQPSQLAAEIAELLQQKSKLRELPDTSVDIIGYRPFYILGSVTTPGEYAYRPGMLVLNALSLAGGAYRSERISEWDLESSAINSRGELRVLELRRADLAATEIRYQSLVDGLTDYPAVPAGAEARVVSAMAEQKRLFDSALQEHHNERASLQATVALHQGEAGSFDRQLADIDRKVASYESELTQVRKLAEQKLAVHRLLPLERELADIKREKKQIELEKLRAAQALETTNLRLRELDDRLVSDAEAGLQRTRAEIRSNEEQLATFNRLLSTAAGYSARLEQYNDSGSTPRLSYTIVRTVDGVVNEIPVEETTQVEPGDIVKVTITTPGKST